MWFVVWGDLLFELRFTTFQTAKQLLWWEILLAPLTASTPDIKQNSLEIPGALIFCWNSVDPQNYRSFPPAFLAGKCWCGDARCQPVRTGVLECEARTYLDSSICFCQKMVLIILLMEEILHHLGWLKPYKQWDNHHPWWCRILSINSRSQGLLMATRNPVNSPVEVGSLSQYLRRVFYIPSCLAGFLNHQ